MSLTCCSFLGSSVLFVDFHSVPCAHPISSLSSSLRPSLPCLEDHNLTSLTEESSRPLLPVFPRASWQLSKSPSRLPNAIIAVTNQQKKGQCSLFNGPIFCTARERMFHLDLPVFASTLPPPPKSQRRPTCHLFCSLSYFFGPLLPCKPIPP